MYLIRSYLFYVTGVVKLWVLLNIQVSTNSKGWPRLEFDYKSSYSILSCIDVMFKGSEIGAGKAISLSHPPSLVKSQRRSKHLSFDDIE